MSTYMTPECWYMWRLGHKREFLHCTHQCLKTHAYSHTFSTQRNVTAASCSCLDLTCHHYSLRLTEPALLISLVSCFCGQLLWFFWPSVWWSTAQSKIRKGYKTSLHIFLWVLQKIILSPQPVVVIVMLGAGACLYCNLKMLFWQVINDSPLPQSCPSYPDVQSQ